MMKNGRTMRIVLNGALLLAIVALGVTVYKAGTRDKSNLDQAQLEELTQEELIPENTEEEQNTTEKNTEDAQEPMVDAGTSDVEAELPTETAAAEEENTTEENNATEETQETVQNEAAAEMVEMQAQEEAAASTNVDVNFTEDSLMEWPLNGELLLDYNMENTVYFPTLDQYRLNSAIAVKSDVGAPVVAAANGTITGITESAQTGLTVTMDLGNGYEAIYGQLKDLTAYEGETLAQGTVLGYVNEPTKYYSVEGSNLYFAMKQDGTAIDPITYLP